MVADHQRRAPRHARRRAGWSTCPPSRCSTSPGPAALDAVQSLAVAQLDVPPRPGRLHLAAGRARRLPGRPDRHAAGRRALPGRHRRRHRHGGQEVVRRPPAADGSPQLTDLTSAWTTLGRLGARGPGTCCSRSPRATVPRRRSAFGTCREIELGGVTVLASRISYVGELGWELYVPIEEGARVWDTLWEAGQPHGLVPVGIGVYGTTGRLEKGYRAYGNELTADYNLVEAGMTRPRVKDAGLHRQGGLPGAARRAAGGGAVHADRGRPPSAGGRAALHARRRADPDRRRRAAGRRQGPAAPT